MNTDELYGLAICRKRNELGLTEYDLSRDTGVDPRTIVNYEQGLGDMNIESIIKILVAIDMKSWEIDIYKRFSTIKEFFDYMKECDTNLLEHSNLAQELGVTTKRLDELYSEAYMSLKQNERSRSNGNGWDHADFS